MGGCFLLCFGASKHRKSPKKCIVPSVDQRFGTSETLQPTNPTKQEAEKDIIESIADSKDKNKEQLDGNIRKKVAFDLKVRTCEEFSTQKIKHCSVECEKEKEKKEEKQNESQTVSDSSMSSVFSYPPNNRYYNCTNIDDESKYMELVESDSVDNNDHALAQQEDSSESLFSLSIESRKQVRVSELDEKEVNSPITICGSPDQELISTGLNQIVIDSVLNPIENLTQWKAVKTRASTPLKDQEKENINLEQEISIAFSEEPSFKSSNHGSKRRSNRPKPEIKNEIAVDTSLSSWLVESETTPIAKSSPNSVGNSPKRANSSTRSNEDRPILGALTVEDLKQLSASYRTEHSGQRSPRRSPSKSPDEIPIIGTVGSYWNHTGLRLISVILQRNAYHHKQVQRGICIVWIVSFSLVTNQCEVVINYFFFFFFIFIFYFFVQNKRVKWNSTSFETRLEAALDREVLLKFKQTQLSSHSMS